MYYDTPRCILGALLCPDRVNKGSFAYASVAFCCDGCTTMLKISYRHPYHNHVGQPAVCHIREYVVGILVVIVCSEVPDNPGTSVTHMAEQIATAVWHDVAQPPLTRFLWIEHYGDRGRSNGVTTRTETFDLVTFQHNVATSQLEAPDWRRITQADVEALIGEAWVTVEPTA